MLMFLVLHKNILSVVLVGSQFCTGNVLFLSCSAVCILCQWWITTLLWVLAVLYYRDEKVSLEQQLSMNAKEMETTKDEVRKIKGEIEEVCFLGLADDHYY
jgi:hypothetical protein